MKFLKYIEITKSIRKKPQFSKLEVGKKKQSSPTGEQQAQKIDKVREDKSSFTTKFENDASLCSY